MNYTDAYVNFTAEQVQRMKNALEKHPARFTLWQEENLKKVFFLGDETLVEVSKRTIFEDKINDGSFSDWFELTLLYGKLNAAVGSYLPVSDYTVSGLPEGLAVKVKVAEKAKLQVELTGKAKAHGSSNNIGFKLTLKKDICDKPLNTQGDMLEILFRNPYAIVYTDCENLKISSSNQSATFQVSETYPSSRYQLLFDGTTRKLRINSFDKYLATEGLSRNIKLLEPGSLVSADLQWIKGTVAYPHDIYTSSYKVWAGKTAYAGFRFEGADNTEYLYGWMRFSVSEKGDSFTLLDYAFNEAPNTPIITGKKDEQEGILDLKIYADKTNIREQEAVVFSANITSDQLITAYLWSFTGGTPLTSVQESPEIIYRIPGVYPVSLTVTDAKGNTKTEIVEDMIRVTQSAVPGEDRLEVADLIVLDGRGEKMFRIEEILKYADNELIFFNRWGKMLYRMKDYGNDLSVASWAPGTYYYVFSYLENGQKKQKKGFVEIIGN